jgi:hypothetical protein
VNGYWVAVLDATYRAKKNTPVRRPGCFLMNHSVKERLTTNVEMGGIEPPSDVVLSGLLRAQFASDFLGPSHAANSWLIRAQSSKSPVHSDDGSEQQWLSK